MASRSQSQSGTVGTTNKLMTKAIHPGLDLGIWIVPQGTKYQSDHLLPGLHAVRTLPWPDHAGAEPTLYRRFGGMPWVMTRLPCKHLHPTHIYNTGTSKARSGPDPHMVFERFSLSHFCHIRMYIYYRYIIIIIITVCT